MSREVVVSAEVAERLGAEQLQRMRGAEWEQSLRCSTCGEWVPAEEPFSVVVLQLKPDASSAQPDDDLARALCAHPGCEASRVVTMTLDQARSHFAHAGALTGGDEAVYEGTRVDVVATMLTSKHRSTTIDMPALVISFSQDFVADAPGQDRIDLVATMLIEMGWQPVLSLDSPATAGPQGWGVRYIPAPAAAEAALVELLAHGEVVTSAGVVAPRPWLTAVTQLRTVLVLQGSRVLTDWDRSGRAVLKRAVRSGSLVGGTVPALVVR